MNLPIPVLQSCSLFRGMSEADMMEFGGWWGYNGKWYISISHYDGVTTIDHVTELPDMSSILG